MGSQTTASARLAYPVALREHQDTILVSFPDVPEALTESETPSEALEEAGDCLVAALGGYVQGDRRVPERSPPHGAPVVELSTIVTAKIALYQAMRDQRVDRTELAERLGVSESAINRLLDLDHRSHLDQIADALDSLGKHLVVRVHTAA